MKQLKGVRPTKASDVTKSTNDVTGSANGGIRFPCIAAGAPTSRIDAGQVRVRRGRVVASAVRRAIEDFDEMMEQVHIKVCLFELNNIHVPVIRMQSCTSNFYHAINKKVQLCTYHSINVSHFPGAFSKRATKTPATTVANRKSQRTNDGNASKVDSCKC